MQPDYPVIALGRTAEVFAIDGQCILKLFKSGLPEQQITTEYQISKQIYDTGISTPQPIEIISYEGRKGIIYERITGETMLKVISSNPGSVEAEAARMARLHHEIHSAPVTTQGLPKQIESLKSKIEEAPYLISEEKAKIIAELQTLREDTRICHGDFHPDNIIVNQVCWVIDWMTGMIGNPAGDVARTMLLFKFGTMPDGTPIHFVELFAQFRQYILERYLKEYISVSALELTEVNQWLIPVAAARLTEWIPELEKQQLADYIRENIVIK